MSSVVATVDDFVRFVDLRKGEVVSAPPHPNPKYRLLSDDLSSPLLSDLRLPDSYLDVASRCDLLGCEIGYVSLFPRGVIHQDSLRVALVEANNDSTTPYAGLCRAMDAAMVGAFEADSIFVRRPFGEVVLSQSLGPLPVISPLGPSFASVMFMACNLYLAFEIFDETEVESGAHLAKEFLRFACQVNRLGPEELSTWLEFLDYLQ